MPTPIGHSLAGYAIYLATQSESPPKIRGTLLCIFLANLPDLDYLPGFLIGYPNYFHHGISHSIGFAVFCGILGMIYSKWLIKEDIKNGFYFFFGIYFSHVFLDFLCADDSIPYGEKLLWPFSNSYYISPITIFAGVHKSNLSSDFILSLFNIYNIHAIFIEFVILLPVVICVQWYRNKRKKNENFK
jgi:inner membrane protein